MSNVPALIFWRAELARGVKALAGAVFLHVLLLAGPAWAGGEALTLGRDNGPVALTQALEYWVDTGGKTPVEQIEAGAGRLPFAAVVPDKKYWLDDAALWLRFDATVQDPLVHWKLELPMSGVDKVALYYRDSLGRWVVQQAGDTLPISAWPLPARYPVFSLNHEVGASVRYYLRVEHARVPFSALPRVLSAERVTTSRQLEHLFLGAYFGLALLVTILALINAAAYRDRGFATYAVYLGTFAGSQAAFKGLGGLYLWPELPQLNNMTIVLLPLLAAAAALWFVRTVTTPGRFFRALDWLILALMGLAPLVGLLDAAFPTPESFALINILVSAGMVVLLMVVGVSLVEGDRHARWIALGFLPIIVATLFPLLRNFGLIASSFLTQNALILGSAVEAPILFYGLLRRVTRRVEPSTRASTLRTTDPLTGLLTTRPLLARLRQALSTAERYQQPCALLVIDLSNHARLQLEHGREIGDRAMVLAAARILAVTKPTDTVARVGDRHFALLLEGPMTSDSVNRLATKILASGLRTTTELPDADPLQFHIAIGYVAGPARLALEQAQACLDRMMQVAKEMNDGSRKAIRMIQL
ncbi:MAG: sensor domain-containing diguanylate cyclase [Polaromonas sp.]|uniref:sensor domain-containing diguanylate cyclase n=1 Tax=Polaromonas sp. TaxID=1869339 RepID=UPI00248726C0|nr:diguanylate cyclase [Polaromonas sp.]MDI1236849.1 sensor domain-containing diguanylate cyclase [Polaromonas sp.]